MGHRKTDWQSLVWLRSLSARAARKSIAAVAQLVERVLGKDEVKGSSPFSSSPRPLAMPAPPVGLDQGWSGSELY